MPLPEAARVAQHQHDAATNRTVGNLVLLFVVSAIWARTLYQAAKRLSDVPHVSWPRLSRPSCVRERALSGWCKSVPGVPTKPVAEGNCVIVRWGGEQPEAKQQSVEDELDSAGPYGEPPMDRRSPEPRKRRAHDAEGRCQSDRVVRQGGWRQRAAKAGHVKRRDLRGRRVWCASARKAAGHRAGVRAPIVAMKPGNAGGVKGCRKVET